MTKEQLLTKELIKALSGMTNAFIKAHGPKAIDCCIYPEYTIALLVLCRHEDTLPSEENM